MEDEINTLHSAEAEEAKYSQVYTEEGKQVLVLFATEYGFSEEVPQRRARGILLWSMTLSCTLRLSPHRD